MPHPAVTSRHPRICVIAAPGSGKSTSIIIPKAVALIADDGVAAEQILLLSFSRVSALDLKQKVSREVPHAPRASTVHSFALRFLLSEDNHGIRDRVDSILLEFQKPLLLSDLQITLPGIDRRQLGRYLDEFSAGWATRPHDQLFEDNDEKRRFKAAVIAWLAEHEAAMLEEIMHHAVALATQVPNAPFLASVQHLMVDEYQDLNQLEQEFVRLIAELGVSPLVVGDPDQSIYGFKYAYPDGIRDYHRQADVEPYESLTTYRCPRAVVTVANALLVQAEPGRQNLVAAHAGAQDGEVHFVRRDDQEQEFDYILGSIAARLASGTAPSEILVLAPKRELARLFSEYAEAHRNDYVIADAVEFAAVQRVELTEVEQERLTLLGLVARPESLLQIRAFLGLGEERHYARELQDLRQRYGGLVQVVEQADPAHFPGSARRRRLCERAITLRAFLQAHQGDADLETVLDEVLPADDDGTAELRETLDDLREPNDTIAELLRKYADHRRSLPDEPNTVRSMTLMASKGLGAEHVFIVGCNAGNIPGANRSLHMTDQEHRLEQIRLLYVGCTRATRSLTVSWSHRIPFAQARRLHTPTVRIRTIAGQRVGEVGLCEFLQNTPNVNWE